MPRRYWLSCGSGVDWLGHVIDLAAGLRCHPRRSTDALERFLDVLPAEPLYLSPSDLLTDGRRRRSPRVGPSSRRPAAESTIVAVTTQQTLTGRSAGRLDGHQSLSEATHRGTSRIFKKGDRITTIGSQTHSGPVGGAAGYGLGGEALRKTGASPCKAEQCCSSDSRCCLQFCAYF